jgi:hypothetical protein
MERQRQWGLSRLAVDELRIVGEVFSRLPAASAQ